MKFHSTHSTHITHSVLSTLSLCALLALFSIHCATSNNGAGAAANCGDHSSLGFEETNFLHVRAIGASDNAIAVLRWDPLPGAVYSFKIDNNPAISNRPNCTEIRLYGTPAPPFRPTSAGRCYLAGASASSLVRITARSEADRKIIGRQTVNLGSPLQSPSLTVTQENDNFLFKWGSVSGTSKYELFQQDNEGNLTLLESPTTTSQSISASTLTTGQIYRYRLRACSNNACSTYATSNLVEIQAGVSSQVQMNIERVSILQSVRVDVGSATKVIAGKPSLLQVYFRANSPIQGFEGTFQLSREATSANPSPTPVVIKTPVTFNAGGCSVVTFNLKNEAATGQSARANPVNWLVPNAPLRIEANAGSTLSKESSSYTSSDSSFSIVEQKPLVVRLFPIQTADTGTPSSSEMTSAQSAVKKLLDNLFPNYNTTVTVESLTIQYTDENGAVPGTVDIRNQDLSRALASFNTSIRALSQTGERYASTPCSDVFHGIIKGGATRQQSTLGRGLILNKQIIPFCPRFARLTSVSYDTRASTRQPTTEFQFADFITHEIGHSHSLFHAQGPRTGGLCLFSGQGPSYPYANASIGTTGYFASENQFFRPNNSYDFMSYCPSPASWISDYHYNTIREFQEALNPTTASPSIPASTSNFFARILSPLSPSTERSPAVAEQSKEMVDGWIILGSKANRDDEKSWAIDSISRSSMEEDASRKTQEALETSTYKVLVRRSSGKEEYHPLVLVDVSHSSQQFFTVWVPNADPILSMEIQNSNNPNIPLAQKSFAR